MFYYQYFKEHFNSSNGKTLKPIYKKTLKPIYDRLDSVANERMNDVSHKLASHKLADTLEQLRLLQDSGVIAIQSKQLSRLHRERLLKHGFSEVLRGWYIASMPGEKPGDSTSWYTLFWDFCAAYLMARFGSQWCLSPEQSISLHIGDKTVPQQLLVRTPKGNNKPTSFLHGTSLFDVRLNLPGAQTIDKLEGLNVYLAWCTVLPVSTPIPLFKCAQHYQWSRTHPIYSRCYPVVGTV